MIHLLRAFSFSIQFFWGFKWLGDMDEIYSQGIEEIHMETYIRSVSWINAFSCLSILRVILKFPADSWHPPNVSGLKIYFSWTRFDSRIKFCLNWLYFFCREPGLIFLANITDLKKKGGGWNYLNSFIHTCINILKQFTENEFLLHLL